MARRPSPAIAMAGLLTTIGTMHFVAPKLFDDIVPESLPGTQRFWTYASGVAELGTAAALVNRRTRRLGALAAAGLYVGVFPANIKMAIDWSDRPFWLRALVYARLPLQLPLVIWALKICRESAGPDTTIDAGAR